MSTLWTPSGEHQPPTAETGHQPPAGERPPEGEQPPEEAEEQLRRLRAELAGTPVVDIVANHVIGLWQLAIVHLDLDGSGTRQLDQARLAIDAAAALVEGLGDRLGTHREPLEEALAQLRMAYVQVSGEPSQ